MMGPFEYLFSQGLHAEIYFAPTKRRRSPYFGNHGLEDESILRMDRMR